MTAPTWHPVWCVLATDHGGNHQSTTRSVQPRDDGGARLDIILTMPTAVAGWPQVPLVHVHSYDEVMHPDGGAEILILPLRQAFLLGRHVDQLLAAAWWPEDLPPVDEPRGGPYNPNMPRGGRPRFGYVDREGDQS